MSRQLGNGALTKARNRKGETVYVGRWTDSGGKYRRRQLGTDARVAQRVLADIIRTRDLAVAGLGHEEGQERMLEDLCTRYIADLGTRRGERHTATSDNMLTALREELGSVRVRQVTLQWALEHRTARQRLGRSNRTCNAELAALRTCLRWGVRTGLIGANPLESLKPLPSTPDTWKRRRHALDEEEIAKVRHAAREQDLTLAEMLRPALARIPQAPMWDVMLGAGLRWCEAATLKWEDVDLDVGTIRVRAEESKSHRRRDIPIGAELVAMLVELRAIQIAALGALPGPWVSALLSPAGRAHARSSSRRANKLFRRVLLRAGVKRERPDGTTVDLYSLRHTYGTRMARLGVMPQVLRVLMGHRDLKTTMEYYVHLTTADTRAAIAAVAPLPLSAIPCTISATGDTPRAISAEADRRNLAREA